MEQSPVQPGPVPTQLAVGTATAEDGTEWTVVQFATASGTGIYFLDRDSALNFAAELRKHAKEGPKLITPPNGLVVPA